MMRRRTPSPLFIPVLVKAQPEPGDPVGVVLGLSTLQADVHHHERLCLASNDDEEQHQIVLLTRRSEGEDEDYYFDYIDELEGSDEDKGNDETR